MKYLIFEKCFEFDNDKLIIDGKVIELPEKAVAGLLLFIHSDRQTLSKDYFMQKLWGDLIVSDDSLFKIIQSIRSLFKKQGIEETVIKNIYGKGYRFLASTKAMPKSSQEISQEKNVPQKKPEKQQKTPSKPIKSLLKRALIALFLLLAIGMSFYQFFAFSSHDATITPKNYTLLKKNLKNNPKASLKQLLKQYDNSNTPEVDKNTLSSLIAQSYFLQGNYDKSLQFLKQAINGDETPNTLPQADAFHQLATIYYYQAKADLVFKNLQPALNYFKKHNNITEHLDSLRLKADYFGMLHQYDKSLNILATLIKDAKTNNNKFAEMRAYAGKYYIYKTLNDRKNKLIAINNVLDRAVEIQNKFYISFAYGELAMEDLEQGHYQEAMQWINKILPLTLKLKDTNHFQLNFSYLYNILPVLGHDLLAEKYLTKAIVLQNYFNSEGHIITAEINLGIIKIKLEKYQQASEIFNALLNYPNLSASQVSTIKAWQAINNYYLGDFITAYAIAKQVYAEKQNDNKTRLVSGIALAISANNLNRQQESQSVYQELQKLLQPNWLIEYNLYLTIALKLFPNKDEAQHLYFSALKQKFDTRLNIIKQNTLPNIKILNQLDTVLENILRGSSS